MNPSKASEDDNRRDDTKSAWIGSTFCNHDVRSLTTSTNAFAFKFPKGVILALTRFSTHFWLAQHGPPRHCHPNSRGTCQPPRTNTGLSQRFAVTLMFAKVLVNTESLSNSSHKTASHVDTLNLVRRQTSASAQHQTSLFEPSSNTQGDVYKRTPDCDNHSAATDHFYLTLRDRLSSPSLGALCSQSLNQPPSTISQCLSKSSFSHNSRKYRCQRTVSVATQRSTSNWFRSSLRSSNNRRAEHCCVIS